MSAHAHTHTTRLSDVGTVDYAVTPGDTKPWTEYHVDFMPDALRDTFNSGIGGYVSQRRLCTRLKPNAPRCDEALIPLLCDLLVVTAPQLHARLRFELDSLTINQKVTKEFKVNGDSLGMFNGTVTKRFNDNNHYQIVYDDGDEEHLDLTEFLEVLQAPGELIARIKVVHEDFVSVLQEVKKTITASTCFVPNCYKSSNVEKSPGLAPHF